MTYYHCVYDAAASIDFGRKGFATRGKAEDGRISYEKGITEALSVFKPSAPLPRRFKALMTLSLLLKSWRTEPFIKSLKKPLIPCQLSDTAIFFTSLRLSSIHFQKICRSNDKWLKREMFYIAGYEEGIGKFCDIIKLVVLLIRHGRYI